MITELQARALSIQELATRLLDADDYAVKVFAQRCLDRLEELEQILTDEGIEYDPEN